MKTRNKLITLVIIVLIIFGVIFIVSGRSSKQSTSKKDIFVNLTQQTETREKLDTATKYLSRETCPFPLVGYDKLTELEKNKIDPLLNNLIKDLSEKKQQCLDYLPVLEPYFSVGNAFWPRIYINLLENRAILSVQANSSQPVTATSTTPKYLDAITLKWPSHFQGPEDTYIFVSLHVTLQQIIDIAKDENISLIKAYNMSRADEPF